MSINLEKKSQPGPAAPAAVKTSIHTRTLSAPVRWGILATSVIVGFVVATALSGGFSFVAGLALSALIYAVVIYAASLAVEGSRYATDRLVTAIVTTFFLAALLPLVSVLYTVVKYGAARFDAKFFEVAMLGVINVGGGGYHAIMGTLIVTALATLISVPIGLMTAIYLVEYGNKGPMSRALTFFVDVMTGIPSIVAGLFATALFTLLLNDPGYRAGVVGAVALSVLMIPVVVRSTEEMLRIVPNELREASYALGVPKWLTITKVVLPTSIAGIATGITLAIARVMGETAPLLIAVGLVNKINMNPFDGRMATLPVFSYYQYSTPGIPPQPFFDRAWTSALVLIIIVMVLNIVARLISKFFAPKTGR